MGNESKRNLNSKVTYNNQEKIYERMGQVLTRNDTSLYNPELPNRSKKMALYDIDNMMDDNDNELESMSAYIKVNNQD
jgi:hypothetical protein